MANVLEKMKFPRTVIFIGSLAAAITAIIVLYNSLNLPKPLTNQSAEVASMQMDMSKQSEAISKVEEKVDENRQEQVSRYVREDRRALYEVENRIKEEPNNPDLIEQKIILEESLEELESEQQELRKKKGD